MTDSVSTELLISADVRYEAESIVRAHVQHFDNGRVAVYETGLTDAIAIALQVQRNRAELAEIERQQAVATQRRLGDILRDLSEHGIVEQWAVCSRCGARAPKADELRHAPGCTLSSYPPPPSAQKSQRPPSGQEE